MICWAHVAQEVSQLIFPAVRVVASSDVVPLSA